MLCVHCGAKNDSDAIYCNECGRLVDKKDTENKHIDLKKIMKNKLVRAIAVVALIVVAGSLVFGGRSYKKNCQYVYEGIF